MFQNDRADGILVVMVCRARHLPNRRKLDKQSPYVLLRINTVARKTPAHFRAGQTPEWTHELRFDLSHDRRPIMRLDVLDETKGDPTPIGGTEIDCSRVFSDCANLQESGKYILDSWYDLDFKGKYAGKIFLEMTFYPSAPLLPPKVIHSSSASVSCLAHESFSDLPTTFNEKESFRHSAPARRSPEEDIESCVFVTSSPQKHRFFRSSDPEPQIYGQSVFEEDPQPKLGRFAKLKGKLMAKEPIVGLWVQDSRSRSTSPYNKGDSSVDHSLLHAPSPLGNLDELSSERGLPKSHSIDMSPPPPPPHSVSGSPSVQSQRQELYENQYTSNSYSRSPNQRSPARCEVSAPGSPSKSRRKPPPNSIERKNLPALDTTDIPFSADNFQLDAINDDMLPTKVFHMEKPVKSLTVMASEKISDKLNPDEIDPRFYAPTPSEHLLKSSLLSSRTTRFNGQESSGSGYIGEGSWSTGKFSPSVFQRLSIENETVEKKPPVPPKIPRGLSEKEYYVLDKENYLKDINGRRF